MLILREGLTISVNDEIITLGTLRKMSVSETHLHEQWGATRDEDGQRMDYRVEFPIIKKDEDE